MAVTIYIILKEKKNHIKKNWLIFFTALFFMWPQCKFFSLQYYIVGFILIEAKANALIMTQLRV